MWLFWVVGSIGFSATSVSAQQVGLLPVPTLQNVEVRAAVVFDTTQSWYTYRYTITNPSTNTGEIWTFDIDVSQPFREQVLDSAGLSIPKGVSTFTFDEAFARWQRPPADPMVPYGQRPPPGWTGGLGADGTAGFSSDGSDLAAGRIVPGETQGGFELISPGLPTIRQIELQPDWVLLTEGEAEEEESEQARVIAASLPFRTKTLGPSPHLPGTVGHWNQLRDDLSEAIALGWIADQALGTTLVSQLASAREAFEANDGTLAKARLQPFIETIATSTPAQRRQEGFDLLRINAQLLYDNTLDTTVPFEPKVTPSPTKAALPIGETYTLTATVVNAGSSTLDPVSGYALGFLVEDGPNQGLQSSGTTDAQGRLQFAYTSTQVGKDRVIIGLFGEVIQEFARAEVTWTGGPDLVVPFFIPPLIEARGGASIELREETANVGSTPATSSTTRCYLSTTEAIDPATARVLLERAVPALEPGQENFSEVRTIQLPSDLPEGSYHLAACADAPGTVVELEEQNNCSFSAVNFIRMIVPSRLEASTNQPPVCDTTVPSVDRLWPPNHKLATVVIQGVQDPDNDPVTVRVTDITQDEPVNGLGDGDTSPDGFGVGTGEAQVRKERSGTGNGRVYAISFEASDGREGLCTGAVSIGVPHDQSGGSVPIGDGQAFDSTQP